MDKYTVDLDKVLNDFEYSEYSLESAKLNKNVQEDSPNTSGYSVRSDTAVKHSINNVFHSLNEYLSSDITPKKVDCSSKNLKNIDISTPLCLPNLTEHSQLHEPQTPNVSSAEPQGQPLTAPVLDLTNVASKPIIPSKGNDINTHQSLSAFIENSEEKTDNFNKSNSCFNPEIQTKTLVEELREDITDLKVQQIESEEIENNCIENVSIIDNNCGVYETKAEYKDVACSNIQNEVSEDILLDLDSNIKTDNNINNELIETSHFKNENTSNENYTNTQLIPETIKETNEQIVNIHKDITTIRNNEEPTIYDADINKEVLQDENDKIGFKDDFDLDEEKLDQYFQELEQELGTKSNAEKPEEKMECKVSEDIDEIKSSETNIQITCVETTTEDTQCAHGTETKNKTIESAPSNETDSEQIVTKANSEEAESTALNQEEKEISLHTSADVIISNPDQKILNSNFEEPSSSQIETEKTSKEPHKHEVHLQKHEVEKNCRPQHLILSEETHETTRKISLIGDPGSTPYNNEYSTKDFEKNNLIKDGTAGVVAARTTSPTYSDVSTDSVSSSSSDDTEYNDAVSEIQDDKRTNVNNSEIQHKTKDASNKETLQNNMISSVEICKNDVTMDKDFKNNLKSNTVEGSDEAGVSNLTTKDANQEKEESTSVGGEECCNDEHAEPLVPTENEEEEEETFEQRRPEQSSSHSLGIDWLGKQAPLWIPDNEATSCLHCDMKFTVIKRRHHCRACGLVLCSKCCNLKYRLEYLDAEARVCKKCYDVLNKDTNSSSGSEISQEPVSPTRNLGATQESTNLGLPNPNNPLEYCSTLPPSQQVDPNATATPSVMVPVGVLKRKGSNKGRSNKSVMFCDGIRPGSDLTNLDTDFNYSDSHKGEKSKKSSEKMSKSGKNSDMLDIETRSFIPSDEKGLPPTVSIFKSDIKYASCINNSNLVDMLKEETLIFALHSNVYIHVKIINMDCCVSQMVWCFSTEGLINVGQDELVILLEVAENENCIPKDIFLHLNNIYLEAVKGSSVKELGLSLHTSSPFLGSKNHAGFVYIRPTFQCLQNVIIPKEPYLIGILIHRWETPWAKLFPLRLVLRLGAEYKYYPSPIISTRDRDSVFVEIGHTIINLLADFRNFSYTLPQIRGLTIHMEDKNTTITIPINRYDQVIKGLSNSSDHILAFAGNFSTVADSHLVCIQDTQSATNNYTTHAINICNQPRKVTGASFIVFNGALKSSSGLTAKSNIVEDGLMIQILPEHMLQVRESLKNMKDHTIRCGCVNEESDETVTIIWGEPDSSFNVAVDSPIDNKSMTGIPSIRVHNGKDYACNSGSRLIRWTEVFIMQSGEEATRSQESMDISKISESIAKATCQALVKYLDLLVSNSFYKIGLRAHLHVENVSYSAGSNNVKLPPIYMKSLDNELIPVLHRITSNNITEQPIILELIFRILNM